MKEISLIFRETSLILRVILPISTTLWMTLKGEQLNFLTLRRPEIL